MQFPVSIRHHFDREVPCIQVTLDYFEILSLLCHQGNNRLIPTPAGERGNSLIWAIYSYVQSQRVWLFSRFGHKYSRVRLLPCSLEFGMFFRISYFNFHHYR